MRIIILFILFFTAGDLVFGQTPKQKNAIELFRLIEKAERKCEKKRYRKAFKLLKKAEKLAFGFNGWETEWRVGQSTIANLRVRIYTERGQLTEARDLITGSRRYMSGFDMLFDSMLIRTYQKEYGADSFKKLLDTTFRNISLDTADDGYTFIIVMPLKNGTDSVRIPVGFGGTFVIMGTEDVYGNISLEPWRDYFMKSRNYQLIMDATVPWKEE